MLKNLPNSFTRDDLTALLNAEGFAGRYDFAYVPMDFRSCNSLAHGFVNMLTPRDAERLADHFEGLRRWPRGGDQACSVGWHDHAQGTQALIERYCNSPVMHHSVPEAYQPRLFAWGQRVPFPRPTQHIKAPKMGGTQPTRVPRTGRPIPPRPRPPPPQPAPGAVGDVALVTSLAAPPAAPLAAPAPGLKRPLVGPAEGLGFTTPASSPAAVGGRWLRRHRLGSRVPH